MADETPQQTKVDEDAPAIDEKEAKAEAELKGLVVQVTETNKKLDDIYDETLRRVTAKKKMLPTDEAAQEEQLLRVQAAKEKYAELRARISNSRREGNDPFIADLMTRNIPAKIKMAETTNEKKDFDAIEHDIALAEKELLEANKEEHINIKKEIEARLKSELQKETGKVDDTDN